MKLKLIFSLSLKLFFFSISLVCFCENSNKVLGLVTEISEFNSVRFYDSTVNNEDLINHRTEQPSQENLLTSVAPVTNLPQQREFHLSDILEELFTKSNPYCVKDQVVVDVVWIIKYPENSGHSVVSIYNKFHKVKHHVVNSDKEKSIYKMQAHLDMYTKYKLILQIFDHDNNLIEEKNTSFSTYCCVINSPLIKFNEVSATAVVVEWTQDECIKDYQLELKNSIPLFDNETEICATNKNKTDTFIDVTNRTSYVFKNLQTFYSYSVILYYTLYYEKENNFSTFYKKEDFIIYDNILIEVDVEHAVDCSERLLGENVKWKVSKNADLLKDFLFYIKVYDGKSMVAGKPYFYTKNKYEYSLKVDLEYALRSYKASVEVWITDESKESKNCTFESHCCVKEPPTILTSLETYDGFTVKWSSSDNCITDYCLYLINNGPMYERPPYCDPDDRSNKTVNVNYQVDYRFTQLKPAYHYAAVMKYTAKFGPSGWSNIAPASTSYTASDKITNITLQSYDFSDTSYSFMENIQWKMPCYQNGNISIFTIYFDGVSKFDKNNIVNKTQIVVPEMDKFVYAFNITEIHPYFEYTVYVESKTGFQLTTKSDKFKFDSAEWTPSKPIIKSNYSTSTSVFVSWDVPEYPNGKIITYKVIVLSKPNFCNTDDCSSSIAYNTTSLNTTVENLTPYTPYIFKVGAYTKRGYGEEDILIDFFTDSDVPENVINIQDKIDWQRCFDDNITCIAKVAFESPRHINGPFSYISLSYVGKRTHFEDHNGTNFWYPPLLNLYEFDLQVKPEYHYYFNITIVNNKFTNSTSYELIAPPAFPIGINKNEITNTLHPTDNLMVQFQLRQDAIDNTNGDVKYIAIYVASKNKTTIRGRWNGSPDTWPKYSIKGRKYCSLGHVNDVYRITEKMWYPFKNGVDKVTVTIGDDAGCDQCNDYCNDQLNENAEYYLIIRLFTNRTYADSELIPFKSGAINRIGLILGCIFGGLCLAVVALGGVYVWRKKYHLQWLRRRSTALVTFQREDPHYIPIKKFGSFYKNIKESPDTFTDFIDLRLASERILFDQTFALLPENRRKNRYTNILPFDHNRVKLKIDEDDEIGSDYVNASYIKGVSDENEYIATQGPLVDTLKDFWKMIIQENVGVIAMVANFIENDQKRCHKYIPNNHETMKIAKDFEVKCCSELHFGSYCIRSLTLKIGCKIHSVTHMQYLDWPDFGVPNDSESILHFCSTLRERHNVQGGLIVVHCSAGVGRTGALIAIDILMQRIKITEGINVFDTVLELRKQRKSMVQTEVKFINT